MSNRRFPAPWHVKELDAAFIIQDATGFPVAYVYFEANDERRGSMIQKMSRDEARRIAVNMARPSAMLGNPGNDETPRSRSFGAHVGGP